MNTHWRLPRGVDELLPPDAWGLELLRRKVLDLFVSWGFEYVELPLIEYLESLLVGSGEDLDLQTLKVVDQVSGRQLGVRADMTSQAVRVDAHSRIREGVQRLCYAGPVVFANPEIAQASRVPIKAGAEIFGAPSLAADAEVIRLMLDTVKAAGIDEPVLLVGHMGIYRALVAALLDSGDLAPENESRLFRCVQRKSESDIAGLLADTPLAAMMAALPKLMLQVSPGQTRLERVREVLADAPQPVLEAVSELEELITAVLEDDDSCALRIDVSELSGYGYHNGPVFAVYHPTAGSALAQGGRYDGIGEVFGRARPATGFDINLKSLLLAPSVQENTQASNDVAAVAPIYAPFLTADEHQADAGLRLQLQTTIRSLREAGEVVWCALSADESIPTNARRLALRDGTWQVLPAAK